MYKLPYMTSRVAFGKVVGVTISCCCCSGSGSGSVDAQAVVIPPAVVVVAVEFCIHIQLFRSFSHFP